MPNVISKLNLTIKIFINVLILSVVIYFSYDFINFKHQYYKTSERLIEKSVNDVLLLNANLRTKISQLLIKHSELLVKLSNNPENSELVEQVIQLFKQQIPSFYTFIMADKHGELITDVFFEKAGRLCRQDIKQYALHETNTWLTIHPGIEQYHYDLIIPWQYANSKRIIFISFFLDELVGILKKNQRPSHDLFIFRKDKSNLIELSAEGSRAEQTKGIYLSKTQVDTFSKNIAGTYWTIIELPQTSLFNYYLNNEVYKKLSLFKMDSIFPDKF
jgi:hypothetical protein